MGITLSFSVGMLTTTSAHCLRMIDRRLRIAVSLTVILLAVAGLGLYASQMGLFPWSGEHSDATVEVIDEEGETLAVIDAEVADTRSERLTGLSEHDSLAAGEGMLFVHDDEDERTYVMRNMSFGIDIVFVDADGEITQIHSAPHPGPDEDGEDHRYSGTGKYVLEVPKGYMDEQGAGMGDRIEIEYHD